MSCSSQAETLRSQTPQPWCAAGADEPGTETGKEQTLTGATETKAPGPPKQLLDLHLAPGSTELGRMNACPCWPPHHPGLSFTLGMPGRDNSWGSRAASLGCVMGTGQQLGDVDRSPSCQAGGCGSWQHLGMAPAMPGWGRWRAGDAGRAGGAGGMGILAGMGTQ